MSWPLLLILLLMLGMMTWPILLLKPSAEQKQRSKQRLALSQQGIKVLPCGPKLPDNLRQVYGHLNASVEFVYANANAPFKQSYLALRNPLSKEWFWPYQRPPAHLMIKLLPCYQSLPDWCLAVQQSAFSSSIFALENTPDAEQLLQALQALNHCFESDKASHSQ